MCSTLSEEESNWMDTHYLKLKLILTNPGYKP